MQRDRMDVVIEHLVASTRCSHCGGDVVLEHVLTKQLLVALIETRCRRCSTVSKRLCFDGEALQGLRDQLEPGAFHAVDRGLDPTMPRHRMRAPITLRDVEQISSFLEQFDGDFKSLFRRGPGG